MPSDHRAAGLVAALVTVAIWTGFIVIGRASAGFSLLPFDIALLRIASELGLIPAGLAAACADSYRELRRLQHRQRLNERPSRIDPDEAEGAREPVRALWRHVFGE